MTTTTTTHGKILSFPTHPLQEKAQVQLGISIETVADLAVMEANMNGANADGGVGEGAGLGGGVASGAAAAGAAASSAARGIALDLFNFMESFKKPGHADLVVPASIFERWLQKFTSKLKRDPNFFLKKGAGGLEEF